MRIGNYVVRPDVDCWVLATIKLRGQESKQAGTEYEADVVYPGRFDQALRLLLDRMLRAGLEPDADLNKAVATVAHFYATIGDKAAKR